jgi:subtilisin family serine protease
VKIWNRFAQGSIAQFLSGLVYAADQGADVINMSAFDMPTDRGIVEATNRAANYAFRKGAVLVSGAGDAGADLDHNGDLVALPCEAPHVLCASATGPTSAAGVTGPWVDVDGFVALYSNYGRSAIDVAAPGGTADPADPPRLQFGRIWIPCTTTPTEGALPACLRGQAIAQPFGTSLSAAHVSGLAALLVAQLGHGQPALIRERILQSADDLGQPGTDPYYGKGRINIARALGLIN